MTESRFERFWFAPVPAEVYAALRIVWGCGALSATLGFLPVGTYWAVDGLAPIPGGGSGVRQWILDAGLSGLVGWTYFAAMVASLVAVIVGYHTRLAVAACFLGSVLFQSWNHLPLSSAHGLQVTMLFTLLWVDSGATFSVDARRRSSMPTPGPDLPIWPIRLMQFQVAILYLSSGLWKLTGPMWRDGSAVHYAVSSNIFHRFPWPVPPEWAGLLAFGTYLTLAWEIAFPVLLLGRWTRRAALVMGLLVHGGIWFGMEVGAFSWLMVSTYLVFVDRDAFVRWITRISPPRRVTAAV